MEGLCILVPWFQNLPINIIFNEIYIKKHFDPLKILFWWFFFISKKWSFLDLFGKISSTADWKSQKSCYNIPLESAKDKLQYAYKNRLTGNNRKYVMTWTLSTLLIEIFRFFFLTKLGVDKKGFPIVCSEFNSLSEKKV